MKKTIASATFLLVFAGYAALQYLNNSGVSYAAATQSSASPVPSQSLASATTQAAASAPPASVPAQTTSPSSSPQSSTPAPPTQTTSPATPAKPKGQYTDGTYTGPSVNAYYGYVEVQATISGGKLTNVTFLQYPSDRSTSRYINSQAMPMLAQEAIQAQSASVDGVSGASDTSAAFEQSLSAALSQAKS